MSATHYDVTRNGNQASGDFIDAFRSLAMAWDKFTRLRGIMIQTKDNDASGNNVYAVIATNYGYAGADIAAKNANAAASFAEIDSAFSNSDAAITQLLDRHL